MQTENGEPLAEDEWPSEYYWRERYPKLFPDSSSELEDEQEQVGHRRKVKRAIVLPVVFFKKSISVYLCDLLLKSYTKNFIDCTCKSVLLLIGHIEGKPFLVHWTCGLAFKLTGIVVLLVSVVGVSLLLCLNKEENKLLIHHI